MPALLISVLTIGNYGKDSSTFGVELLITATVGDLRTKICTSRRGCIAR